MSMARVFATKVWGYEPERWAVLGFSREGSRNNLARDLRPDDWVLHIGTRSGGETRPEDRGIALGIARLSEAQIATKDAVEPSLWDEYLALNGGKAKWPYGLPMVEARRFISPPAARDEYQLIPRFRDANLSLVLATDAVQLHAEEAAAVLAIQYESCELYESAALRLARDHFELRHALSKRRAPIPPSFGERASSYEANPASTYVFELIGPGVGAAMGDHSIGTRKGKRVYKVGYAIDIGQRLSTLNFAFPNLRALSWRPVLKYSHAEPIAAVAMEAELHGLLDRFAAHGAGNTEIFVCREDEVSRAWQSAMASSVKREHSGT